MDTNNSIKNTNLQKNLWRLVKEKNINVNNFEKQAGLSRSSIWSIISGRSKKPSAELVQSLALAFGVTTESLFKDSFCHVEPMTYENIDLFINCTAQTCKIIKQLNIFPTIFQVTEIINAVYEFDPTANESDEKVIRWIIKNKIVLKS